MWLIAGYFDESYDDEAHGSCFTVAGLMGNQMATTSLAMRWKDLNEKWEISYFKASELNAGLGQFKKFRDHPNAEEWMPFSKREKDLFRQIKTDYTDLLVRSPYVYGVGVTLILPDYRKLRKESALARKNLLTPYHLCAQLVLMESGMQIHEANQGAKGARSDDTLFLKPTFDSHEKYANRMKRAFIQWKQKNPISSRYMLDPDYESEISHRALQAADNLAYEARRYLMYRHFSETLQPRIAMTRLLEAGSFLRLYKLDYRSLKLLAENQSEDQIPVNPTTTRLDEIVDLDSDVEPNDG